MAYNSRFSFVIDDAELVLPLGDSTVGRHAACDVPLPDSSVSRKHAVVRVEEDRVVLEDLSSRNGVWVNGVRLDGPRELADGDRIQLGDREVVLKDEARQHRERRPTRPVRSGRRRTARGDEETGEF